MNMLLFTVYVILLGLGFIGAVVINMAQHNPYNQGMKRLAKWAKVITPISFLGAIVCLVFILGA